LGGTVKEERGATGAERDLQPVTGPSVIGAKCAEDDKAEGKDSDPSSRHWPEMCGGVGHQSALRASADQSGMRNAHALY